VDNGAALIRPADAGDDDAIWAILEPVIRAVQLGREYEHPCRRPVAVGRILIAARLPGAFEHPTLGFVDSYVMYQIL